MGEIGIPHSTLLYDLTFWQLKRIISGYRRRQRNSWEQTRWQTFWLLHNGMLDCKKAGINSPTDLIQFPWDSENEANNPDAPNEEEIARLRKEMQEYNRRVDAERQAKKETTHT